MEKVIRLKNIESVNNYFANNIASPSELPTWIEIEELNVKVKCFKNVRTLFIKGFAIYKNDRKDIYRMIYDNHLVCGDPACEDFKKMETCVDMMIISANLYFIEKILPVELEDYKELGSFSPRYKNSIKFI